MGGLFFILAKNNRKPGSFEHPGESGRKTSTMKQVELLHRQPSDQARQLRGIVDCDGGGFTLRNTPSGILLSLEGIRMAIVPEPRGETGRIDNTVDIGKGKDDDTFRSDAVSTLVCSRLFDKIDWNAVGNQNQ